MTTRQAWGPGHCRADPETERADSEETLAAVLAAMMGDACRVTTAGPGLDETASSAAAHAALDEIPF